MRAGADRGSHSLSRIISHIDTDWTDRHDGSHSSAQLHSGLWTVTTRMIPASPASSQSIGEGFILQLGPERRGGSSSERVGEGLLKLKIPSSPVGCVLYGDNP